MGTSVFLQLSPIRNGENVHKFAQIPWDKAFLVGLSSVIRMKASKSYWQVLLSHHKVYKGLNSAVTVACRCFSC